MKRRTLQEATQQSLPEIKKIKQPVARASQPEPPSEVSTQKPPNNKGPRKLQKPNRDLLTNNL